MKEAMYPATVAGYTRLMTENETHSRKFGAVTAYQNGVSTVSVAPLVTVKTELDKVGTKGAVIRVTYTNHYGHYTKPDVCWYLVQPISRFAEIKTPNRKTARLHAGVAR